MKKQKKPVFYIITAIILAITCAIGVGATFDDVSNSPYKEAIEGIADLKITIGIGDGTFGVNDKVTRQQMTLFMARLLTANEIDGSDKDAINISTFTDIKDSTYFESISYCYENKIINGRSETVFDPLGNVSVQEAITIAVRALGYTDLVYPDGYIETAKHFGLLKNLENVTYTEPMTRGQVAQLLYNALHNVNAVGEYGKSIYDAKFSKKNKLGYFEITSLDELKANYTCRDAKYNLYDFYDSYIVEDVTFMGYTGDIQYYFAKNETAPNKYEIYFRFTIMGEKKALGPVNQWIENPCNELTAAEAKKLIETINVYVARFAERPVTEFRKTLKIGVSEKNVPKDMYKATVDNYASLLVSYTEKNGNKYLPKLWSLGIDADASGKIEGCILKGEISYEEDWN